MVIIDTTVWIDYLNGTATPETEWLDREAERRRLGVLDLCVCEVLQGLATDQEAARVLNSASAAARCGRPSTASSPRSVCDKDTPCSTQTAISTPSRSGSDSKWFALRVGVPANR